VPKGLTTLLADVTPLRVSPAFRRLWAGTVLSAVGGGLTRFAVSLQVYQLTRSPAAVGLLGIAQLVPTLTIGLLGGTITDSVDRRRLVLGTSCGLWAVSAGFAAVSFAGPPLAGARLVWLLYGLVVVQAALAAIDQPARSTFTAGLLPPAQIPAALALNRVIFQVALTASPAIGGLITAAPHLGLRACYVIDAASFGAAIYGVARLPPMRPARAGRRDLRAVLDGIRFVRREQALGGAFLADLAFTVLGLPVALFPAINAERFGGDPRTLGLLTTAVGVGGLVGVVLSGPLRHVRRPGLAMLECVALSGAAFAVFAIAPGLPLTLAALAVVGAADGFTVVFRGTVAQTVTPEELRGRVMAAEFVIGAGGSQLGYLESGVVGSLATPDISALSGGLATIIAVLLIGALLPGVRRYRLPGTVAAARELTV
jgi:MFS family permease